MKSPSLAGVLLLFSTVTYAAQTAQQPTNVTRVAAVPAVVRGRMPRGASTRFFGKAPMMVQGREAVWLHFYTIPTRRRAPADADNPYAFNPNDYVLDVFGRANARRRLRLLNSVKMSGDTFFQENRNFAFVTVRILWLNPTTRQTPIIWLHCSEEIGGSAAVEENDILIVFAHGFSSQASAQDFDSSSDFYRSVNNEFTQTDARGLLVVMRRFDCPECFDITEERLSWNGYSFVSQSRTTVPKPHATPSQAR